MLNNIHRKLAVLALGSLACVASADNLFLPNDATLDASTHVAGTVFVGYANLDDYVIGVNGTSPTITMLTGAGIENNLETFNGSTLNMSGGDVGLVFGSLLAYHNTTTNMSGGTLHLDAEFQNTATFNFSGGEILDDVVSHDTTRINISGGSIGHAVLLNGSSVNTMSGGTVAAEIWVQDASSLTMFGPDLIANLTDPNFQGGFYSQYTMSGHLANGTDISGQIVNVQNGSGAQFNVVPEPASILTLGGLAIGLLRRRRKAPAA
jgi:hypothetical protein